MNLFHWGEIHITKVLISSFAVSMTDLHWDLQNLFLCGEMATTIFPMPKHPSPPVKQSSHSIDLALPAGKSHVGRSVGRN